MAWLKNKKTGGWFEIPDEDLDKNKYMNKKIREKSGKIKEIGKTIKENKNLKRTELNDKRWEIAQELDDAYSGNRSPSERHELERAYEENEELRKKAFERPTIKGREKTNEEIYRKAREARKAAQATPDIDDRKRINDVLTSRDKAWIKAGQEDEKARRIAKGSKQVGTYKLKTERAKQKEKNVYKKKQYSDKKSITTPSGYYSPKELHERESRIKNEYIKFWHGKSNPTTFEKNKDKLIKTGKATEREYRILQYDASRLDDRLKARNKKVSLKGVKKRK